MGKSKDEMIFVLGKIGTLIDNYVLIIIIIIIMCSEAHATKCVWRKQRNNDGYVNANLESLHGNLRYNNKNSYNT